MHTYLHYITLRYITLRYITLHYITLQSLQASIHTYVTYITHITNIYIHHSVSEASSPCFQFSGFFAETIEFWPDYFDVKRYHTKNIAVHEATW